MEIILNGKEILTEKKFYDELCSQNKEFGPYFGRNLDAFRDFIDLLSGWTIIWYDFEFSKNLLGDFFVNEIIGIIHEYNQLVLKYNQNNNVIKLLY